MLFFFFSAAKESNNFYLCNTFFSKISASFFTKKVGKLPASHRYNRLPLLSSDPGGFQQELVAQDLPGAKVEIFNTTPNKLFAPSNFYRIQETHLPKEFFRNKLSIRKNSVYKKKIALYLSKIET